ncbi:MAG TPA: AAA family ATPase, partial [Puia sp.]|nr:AAA family ATPase [Puia sp.]
MVTAIETVTRDLGGIMCNCSPEKNGHPTGPIGPAGICLDCGTEGPFYRQAIENYQMTHNGHLPHIPDISERYTPINWHTAFKEAPTETEWLFPPMIEAGTLNVLFGLPGVGKSLLTLEIALEIVRDGKTVVM